MGHFFKRIFQSLLFSIYCTGDALDFVSLVNIAAFHLLDLSIINPSIHLNPSPTYLL